MAMKLYICLFLSMTSLYVSQSARILGIFPVPSKSHKNVMSALTGELARRGHQVTVISPYKEDTPIANLTDIVIKTSLEENKVPQDPFIMRNMNLIQYSMVMWNAGSSFCINFFKNSKIKDFIQSEEHQFDVVIVEAFMNECFLGFAHKFKAPIIQLCPFGGTNWMGYWIGNPSPFAHVPDPFLDYKHNMNFWQRFVNTIRGLYWWIGQEFYNLPRQEAIMRLYFNDSTMPPLRELVHNTSLLLVNNHFSLSYPKPLMPNLIQVGGMHVKPPKKLPQDVQKFLDETSEGVIYFSMGSILQTSLMSESVRNAFLNAFSKLKQRVLWKWETDSLPGQPDNVMVRKWLPQSDILAHPNVRLFITHGGLLSMQEAMTYGVPLLGIPIFGDQRLNIRRAEYSSYGILLEYDNITMESALWSINTALEPRFRENAQKVSRIYRDQPLTPLEQAVFWTEYVIRHKGAPHMRSAALDLTWYQYFLLDVIVVLIIAIGFPLSIVFFLLRMLFRMCSRPKSLKDSNSFKRNKKVN